MHGAPKMSTDQKTEIPGLYKVSEGILVNKDKNALIAYKKRRDKANEVENLRGEVGGLHLDVNSLKDMMTEIRDMLKGIIK